MRIRMIDRKFYLVGEKSFTGWKLCKNIRQRMILCVVRHEVYGDGSSSCRETHTCTCFLVVEAATKREHFDFAMCFIMLLWSRHLATIRNTILESKGCNPYSFYVNSDEINFMCFNQGGAISSLNGKPLKLVDQYVGSYISSPESDVNTRIGKILSAIDRLMTIQKSDLFNKMKREFFEFVDMSVLLYG